MSLLKLQQMIDDGSTWYYRGKPTIIKKFENKHGEIEILTEINGKPQVFVKENEEKLDLFLENFKPIPVSDDIPLEPEKNNAQLPAKSESFKGPAIYQESKEQFKCLTKILLDDIDKVRNDPGYVGQAKQVSNNVNTIVNITKLQLMMLKEG